MSQHSAVQSIIKLMEDGPITDIGRRGILDPVQMSPLEKKSLDDRMGHRPYTKQGQGKQVLLTGSVAAVLVNMWKVRGISAELVAIHRKLLSLSGFHASHDREFTPKNSLHYIPQDHWLNRKVLKGRIAQPQANRLPNQPKEKGKTYVNKAHFRTGLYTVETKDYSISYAIYPEKIVIHNISYTDKRLSKLDSKENNGLYLVVEENGFWRIRERVKEITTQYAAVNGQSNNLNKAVWLMGEHLRHRYGAVRKYTLFHNRTYGGTIDTLQSMTNKLAMTTRTAKELCKKMQSCQRRGHEVRWMGHSQGAIMLYEAVNWHLNTNGQNPVGAAYRTAERRMEPALKAGLEVAATVAAQVTGGPLDVGKQVPDAVDMAKGVVERAAGLESKATSLSVHTVALHGAATNKEMVRAVFKQAGVKYFADVSHPLDMVNSLTGFNWDNQMQFSGSRLFAPHVMKGTVAQSTHTLPFKGIKTWESYMKNGHPDFPNEFGTGFSAEQQAFFEENKKALIELANDNNFVDKDLAKQMGIQSSLVD